ncbi:hypothetical protein COV15_00805 [Candidatus Woesearchaeota archaeon CG10_big_fil_rev_8_21_14_0_10_34_12]|nr:MAG: hypothetical protein COV15_00805 [Candidatus Woesearchaeota archaeon CG10_big_fil_rev_8_21_14_0_10_34_12]
MTNQKLKRDGNGRRTLDEARFYSERDKIVRLIEAGKLKSARRNADRLVGSGGAYNGVTRKAIITSRFYDYLVRSGMLNNGGVKHAFEVALAFEGYDFECWFDGVGQRTDYETFKKHRS